MGLGVDWRFGGSLRGDEQAVGLVGNAVTHRRGTCKLQHMAVEQTISDIMIFDLSPCFIAL